MIDPLKRMTLATLCALALVPRSVAAQATAEPQAASTNKPQVVKVGDPAPIFAGRTDEDKPWKSADYVGKQIVVVYFYPADMTGGCTAQACAYRDKLAELKRDDVVVVVGVSGDTVESHRMFKALHELNFTLLADPEGKIARAFGVKLGPGGAISREFEGQGVELARGVTAARWTFVIGLNRRIAYKNTKVDAAKDPEAVLKAIAKLEKAKKGS
ncbi:MAG: redoxin domain-containing protein [Pirellulales bacterium]|nr:redoxin domain-containing protein [Pirellulales bacterium]